MFCIFLVPWTSGVLGMHRIASPLKRFSQYTHLLTYTKVPPFSSAVPSSCPICLHFNLQEPRKRFPWHFDMWCLHRFVYPTLLYIQHSRKKSESSEQSPIYLAAKSVHSASNSLFFYLSHLRLLAYLLISLTTFCISFSRFDNLFDAI